MTITNNVKTLKKQRDQLLVFSWISGLGKEYDTLRSQLLGNKEMKTLDQVFSMVQNASTHREIVVKTKFLCPVAMRIMDEVVVSILEDVVVLGEDEDVVEGQGFVSTVENSVIYATSVRSPLDHKVILLYVSPLLLPPTSGSLALELVITCQNPYVLEQVEFSSPEVERGQNLCRWKKAMEEEMAALKENQTWDLIHLLNGKTSIGCAWVYMVKTNPDGSISWLKARFVAKGYAQTYGVDYTKTFSPMAKSICYMEQPHGFIAQGESGKVCESKKSLYDLKQSPRAWFGRFSSAVVEFGMHRSGCDHNVFSKQTDKMLRRKRFICGSWTHGHLGVLGCRLGWVTK
ncbi:uncharacterized protein LOC116005171 [Ipomoea triloba]|uniref:uncharacterized protein LOC116005171 n=1 Tax=Ipomoea triloba TaxID=35885 RepID=UPI00125DDC20|nr:uncharacterized protein LOC116005171 [Ipomoea triloba]